MNPQTVETRNRQIPQVKICGLTSAEQAAACAAAGADAIGIVFYLKSPRYIDTRQAVKICSALPEGVARVGVFVDAAYDTIMAAVDACGLTAVQLHGRESPAFVRRMADTSVTVIKALYAQSDPGLDLAPSYRAAGYLVECKRAALPGGNALSWNWSAAQGFSNRYPMVLAGGLTPENVSEAVAAAQPDAVDVSSGVESRPGLKNIDRVRTFIDAVSKCQSDHPLRRIF